jgi:replication factor A1
VDEYNNRFSLTLNGATCLPDDAGAIINIAAPPAKNTTETINLDGLVQVLFPSRSSAIAQSGVLAYQGGIMRFTVWANANAPALAKGSWYRFESAVSDEYNGQMTMKVGAQTRISPLTGDALPKIPHTKLADVTPGIVSFEGNILKMNTMTDGPLAASGVIADETGGVRFTIRQGEPVAGLQESEWYSIEYASADLYRGAMSLQLSSSTKVTPITHDQDLVPAITQVGSVRPGIVSLRVKVVQEYESLSDRILQSGVLGDETGTIRFVAWKDDTTERLTPGKIYVIGYASADEYNGRPSLTLNGAVITPDEEGTIEVKASGDEVTGALVHISPGSGLIKRCPVEGCGRVLTRQNYCQIHEIQPKFEYDLRIKGWLDNGRQTWDTIISREGVENLLGLTLEGAQEMAENNPLGLETVYYHLCEKLLGRYIRCHGRVIENRLFSTSCSYLTFDPARHADLINRTTEVSHE